MSSDLPPNERTNERVLESDDNVTRPVTLRQSIWDDLDRLFALVRASSPVGSAMSYQDCFQMLLTGTLPYLTSQLRQQQAVLADRSTGESPVISELSLVGTDDLISELGRRFSQLLIAGEVRHHDKVMSLHIQHLGSKISAIGLARFAEISILNATDKGDSGH